MCDSAENSVRVNVRVGVAALGLAFILYSLTNLSMFLSSRAGMFVCFVH